MGPAKQTAHQDSVPPPATALATPPAGGANSSGCVANAFLRLAQLSCRKSFASGAPSMVALMHTCRHACNADGPRNVSAAREAVLLKCSSHADVSL